MSEKQTSPSTWFPTSAPAIVVLRSPYIPRTKEVPLLSRLPCAASCFVVPSTSFVGIDFIQFSCVASSPCNCYTYDPWTLPLKSPALCAIPVRSPYCPKVSTCCPYVLERLLLCVSDERNVHTFYDGSCSFSMLFRMTLCGLMLSYVSRLMFLTYCYLPSCSPLYVFV